MRIIKVTLILVTILVSDIFYGQQDPHYTQYMYNTMSINPAYSGSRGHGVINALGRTQWVGFDGAPDTQTLSFDTPLGYSGIGLGFNLVNDRIGPSREISLDGNLSYHIQVTYGGRLSFGLKLGGRLLNVDSSKFNASTQNLEDISNKFLPTLGAGIYYYTDNFYAGVSVPNFIRTEHYDDTLEGGNVGKERFHFFGILGYVFNLSDSIKFKPASIVKVVPGAPISLDVSANFLFNERFRAGVAWRWDDSISALLGFNITRSFLIGYAYDLTTSNYSNYNSGSHEVMLRYEFLREGAMKSPRFF